MAPSPLARDQVLDVACELFVRDGVAACSLRRVANVLGVTPMALYRHVDNKEDLLSGVLERGFAEFEVYLSRSKEGTTGLEQLRLAAQGFLGFALERGSYFELMFLGGPLPGTPKAQTSVRRVAEPTFVLLRNCVRAAIEDGGLPDVDAHGVAVGLLAQATGIVALHRCGLFPWSDDETRARAEQTLEVFLDGARSNVSK